MTIGNIIEELDAEIARLQEVKKLLSNTSNLAVESVTGPRSTVTKRARRKKRALSAEAREKIGEAQRKRWAAQKAKK